MFTCVKLLKTYRISYATYGILEDQWLEISYDAQETLVRVINEVSLLVGVHHQLQSFNPRISIRIFVYEPILTSA